MSVRRVAPVLLLVLALPLFGAKAKSSSRPPTDLHRVGDHWTAYNPPDPSTYAPGAKTYTVKAGDTLSGIAKAHLGSAGAYMKIFDLNKDQLTDPDKIKPGQVLRLP